MQRKVLLSACWTVALSAACCPADDLQSTEPHIAFGTITSGRLISFVEEDADHGSRLTWYFGDLSTSRVAPLVTTMPNKAEEMSDMLRSTGCLFLPAPFAPHRWRIREDHFWAFFLRDSSVVNGFVIMRMGLSDHPGNTPDANTPDVPDDIDSMFGPVDGSTEKWRELTAFPELPGSRQDLQIISDWGLRYLLHSRAPRARNHPSNLFECDILPVGPRRLLLLVIVGEKLELWRYDYFPTKQKHVPAVFKRNLERDIWLGTWTLQDDFPIRLKEPFHAFQIPQGVAIVTDSGKSYVGVMDPQQRRSSGLVWGNELRPLIALVDVPEQGRCYAFGKDFYFVLSDRPEPKECRDVTANGSDYGEPMHTVWECAKVLRENGELEAATE